MSIESFNKNMDKAISNLKDKIKDDIKEMCNWDTVPEDVDLEKIFKNIEKYIRYKDRADKAKLG